ncbi:MAG: transposase [Alicyclobacillus herbarius]|uniref:RNA-guided endonuclease InsQ/TnpB family protein n=1 Tax=Alicyclobacillus herbarius TaxID=122960 RepID=UPI002357F359|nr:transposase [Alicyclobacillus herbarius]MCL6632143.1 transposase [Alicyclobacillus herbarius]
MRSSSSTSKTKSTYEKKKRTPSFVCEIPLRVTRRQEQILEARFEAGRQMYNALLGEAKNRLALVRQSVWYAKAKASRDKQERRAHFAAARQSHGFSKYDLEAMADEMRRTTWLGEHLDSHVAQKLADRAFRAVERVAFGKAKTVRFKGQRGLHSLEGKTNAACIRWRDDRVLWNGLELPMVKGADRDPVIQHGLASHVKYVRLVRKSIRGRNRYYAQLVCEGIPYVKVDENGERIHPIGDEVVGIDIGPSTIAIVGDTRAELKLFAEEVARDHKQIRRLQRKLDRQRRANNPDCYDDQGRAIKGKHPTRKSRHGRKTEAVLAELYRREAAHRKTLHGQLSNQILEIGKYIKTEKLSFKAFQKMFGRSIGVRAPRLFLSILTRKAESAGGYVEEFSTYQTALSQTCICEKRHKKRLSERVHECECGVVMQRDLFSAYLAKHVENERLQVAEAKASWQGAEPLLRTAWQQAVNQPASGGRVPSSFGTFRSQSGSSEKESLPEHEAQDVVAAVKTDARACESARV